MDKEYYPDVFRKRELRKNEPEEQERALQKSQESGKRKVAFNNNTFINCVFVFNFRGPEDREEDQDE